MFGEVLRAHRRRLSLTQEDLAARAGVSVRSISKVECGEIVTPRPHTVRMLADALGLNGEDRDGFYQAATDQDTLVGEPGSTVAGPPAPGTGAGGVARPVPACPAQLPAAVAAAAFVGRAEELRRLDSLLDTPQESRIVVITGAPGVGKTTLAVRWAHRVRDRFPDGQLYVNLKGFDDGAAARPDVVLASFLHALGVPVDGVPTRADRTALFRSALAGRRMLVVLDNARDADQVRPLIPGTEGCLTLITSRGRLTSLRAVEGAYGVALDMLDIAGATAMLSARIGAARAQVEPAGVATLASRCEGLPLAVAVVAAQVLERPALSLATVAARLADARHLLEAFDGDDATMDLRAVFSYSYDTLTPAAARLFALLSIHPGPAISLPAAAALAELPPRKTQALLLRLARAHLVSEPAPDTYTMHDLLRAYADDVLSDRTPPSWRHAATGRLLDHYLRGAHAAVACISPGWTEWWGLPHLDGPPARFSGREAAVSWLDTEHQVILTLVAQVADNGFDDQISALALTIHPFLNARGLWTETAGQMTIALTAAQRMGHGPREAYARLVLGDALAFTGRPNDGRIQCELAYNAFMESGDLVGQIMSLKDLGHICRLSGMEREALEHTVAAVDVAREHGDFQQLGLTLNNLGHAELQRGNYTSALTHSTEAVHLLLDSGNLAALSIAWDTLGAAHACTGGREDAIRCYDAAAAFVRELGSRRQVHRIGTILDALSNHREIPVNILVDDEPAGQQDHVAKPPR